MTKVIPVILAGGTGERLWPLSRKSYPKQFSNLVENNSLFQHSILRTASTSKIKFSKPIIVTHSDYRFIIEEQMKDIGVEPEAILLEPHSKNTAPAILAATVFAENLDSDCVFLVLPADHLILDLSAFHKSLLTGLKTVKDGNIAIFGVAPTQPQTGYGYLEVGSIKNFKAMQVKRFVEKPSLEIATGMVNDGNHLWNAGIFMFNSHDIKAAFKKYSPALHDSVHQAVKLAERDLSFLRLDEAAWMQCENISIDYAVMEKANNLVANPLAAGWSDLGEWAAILDLEGSVDNGALTSDNVLSIGCENTLLRSESSSMQVVGLGLKDTVVVAMPDAVLVANTDSTHEMKNALRILKSQQITQAENFPKDFRPWGHFEILSYGHRFQVKRIFVKPGAALSLQSHYHRSEHWIVVAGTAKVTIGEKIQILCEGKSIYIPLGAKHRLENPGKVPCSIIEVQTGPYLGEDDIVRYGDIYKRD